MVRVTSVSVSETPAVPTKPRRRRGMFDLRTEQAETTVVALDGVMAATRPWHSEFRHGTHLDRNPRGSSRPWYTPSRRRILVSCHLSPSVCFLAGGEAGERWDDGPPARVAGPYTNLNPKPEP